MLKKCICRELSLSNPTEFYGHFVFTSLDHGEGITLGNMIRRTLLSSLSGSKIVGVKISKVNHEFSDIEGIREDILEIFLNLKEVIIKNPLNHSVCYGKLNIQGPAIVTAGLISLPKDILVLNPEQYLFTISEQIFIEVEVEIECGKSYVLSTDRQLDTSGEFFPIDANFTPILNVEYHIQPVIDFVENSREELHMIVSTNGTLLPQEALLIATNHLSELLLGCRQMEGLKSKNSREKFIKRKQMVLKDVVEKEKPDPKNLENFFRTNVFEKKKSSQQKQKNLSTAIKTLSNKSTKIPSLEKQKYSLSINEKKDKENGFLLLNSGQSKQFLLSEKYLDKLSKATKETKDRNLIYTPTKILDLRTIDIEITCLPPRILTALKKEKINSMSDLLEYSFMDLQKIKGLGPVSIKKIKDQIELFFEAISL